MQGHRLFIGNLGAGKSTLANCIAERVLFKSGIFCGSGKTDKLDKKEANGIMYLDIPALANIKNQQAAANAITEALKQNGKYQIFFVVKLNAGKLRPEDVITIWLVLESAPYINHFSIIINKLSKKEYGNLQSIKEESRLLAPLEIMAGRKKNITLLLLQNSWMLEDAEDQIENFPELVEFVRNAPWVDAVSSDVNKIPCDNDAFMKKFNLLSDHQKSKRVRILLLFISYYYLSCYFVLELNDV